MDISPSLRNICIVGGGQIGLEYSTILSSQSINHDIVSRSIYTQFDNHIKKNIIDLDDKTLLSYDGFIVCVQPENNFDLTKYLINKTNSPILIEKPLSLKLKDHLIFSNCFDRIYVALNRRKFDSTKKVKTEIEDSSILKATVELTEIKSRISGSQETVNSWPLANTIHVIDMALYLAGIYDHNRRDIVLSKGSGLVRGEILSKDKNHQLLFFDFESLTGNWGINIATEKGRFILRPLEEIQFQSPNSIKREKINLASNNFKNGFLDNVIDFVSLQRNNFINYEEYNLLVEIINFLYQDTYL